VPEYEQLLAEDEEFEIAIGARPTTDDEQVDHRAEESVQERQEHWATRVVSPALPVELRAVACSRISGRLQHRQSRTAVRASSSPPTRRTSKCNPRLRSVAPKSQQSAFQTWIGE
jgi:hypothetical protein